MTVENQTPYQSFTANGTQTAFAFNFYAEDKSNLEVKNNDKLVSINDYRYDKQSNTVIFNNVPSKEDLIEVKRVTPLDRSIQYATYDNSFRPEVLNYDLDRIIRILQELGLFDGVLAARLAKEIIDRTKGDQYLQEQILKEIKDRINGDADLQRQINSNDFDIANLFDGLAQEIKDRMQGDRAVALASREYTDFMLKMNNSNPSIFDGISDNVVITENGESQRQVNRKIKDTLNKIIDEPTGLVKDQSVLTWSGRTQNEKNQDAVVLEDYCKLNGTDETEGFILAATQAKQQNKKLISSGGRILLTKDVNLRHLNFDLSATELKLINCTVHAGASGKSAITKNQTLGLVYNNSFDLDPKRLVTPSVKIWGSKCLKFNFDQIDYLLLYASTDPSVYPVDSSISYSSFTGELVTKLELNTDPRYAEGEAKDGAGSKNQWINSNFFYISRMLGIDIKGSYQHNGNIFYNSTLETPQAYINIEVGNKNIFTNVRMEGYPTVFLGETTVGNIIERVWFSTEATVLHYPNVTDLGVLNKVTSVQETRMNKFTVLDLNTKTDSFFNGQAMNFGNLNPSRKFIKTESPYSFIAATNPFEIAPSDIFNFKCNTEDNSITSRYIARVYFYDKDMKPCTQIEDDWIYSVNFKTINKTNGYVEGYFLSVGDTFISLHPKARAEVKYISIYVLTNNSLILNCASHINISLLTMRNLRDIDSTKININRYTTMPITKPTKYIGYIGDRINGLNETWRCTFSLDTVLKEASSSSTIIVDNFYINASFSGWKVGDLIGIELDNNTTFWTKLKTVNTNTATLEQPLPSLAQIGNSVYISRLE